LTFSDQIENKPKEDNVTEIYDKFNKLVGYVEQINETLADVKYTEHRRGMESPTFYSFVDGITKKAIRSFQQIVHLTPMSFQEFDISKVETIAQDIKLASNLAKFYWLPPNIKKNLDRIKMSSLKMKVTIVLSLLRHDIVAEKYFS